MFITFGFGQNIGGKNLNNHYMKIEESELVDVIGLENGTYPFAFRYPDDVLDDMISDWSMKEITKDEYLALKDSINA